jgi:hypothetical protein
MGRERQRNREKQIRGGERDREKQREGEIMTNKEKENET